MGKLIQRQNTYKTVSRAEQIDSINRRKQGRVFTDRFTKVVEESGGGGGATLGVSMGEKR